MKKSSLLLLAVLSVPTATFAGGVGGPYIGVGIGYVSSEDSGFESFNGAADGYTQETTPEGAAYGLFGGYNWNVAHNLVVGVEADYEQRSASDTEDQANNGVPDPRYTAKTDLKAAYSLRAKVGHVFAGGRTLVYATGGYAVANIKRTFSDLLAPASQSDTESQSGWTAGLGAEQQVSNNLSMRLEYRYADYGKGTADTSVVYGPGYLQNQEYNEHSLRVGVAYRF